MNWIFYIEKKKEKKKKEKEKRRCTKKNDYKLKMPIIGILRRKNKKI